MKFFITGGAGFIGCNSADYFLQQGHEVVVFDNLSRKGGQPIWNGCGRGIASGCNLCRGIFASMRH